VGSPRPVTEIALLFYIIRCSYLKGNTTYGLPQPVTGIASLLYVDDVRTTQETSVGLHGLLRR
jgi:hypothetical protein